MSYQPQYHHTPAMRPANHWLDLLVKAGTLLVAVTVAATMGAHLIRTYSPPARTAAVAQIVTYYSKGGLGAMGASSHWTMEASEGSAEWTKAVAYCQAQAQDGESAGQGQSVAPGCNVIETLSQSGY